MNMFDREPKIIELINFFTQANIDAKKHGEDEIPLTDWECYADQISNIWEGILEPQRCIELAKEMAKQVGGAFNESKQVKINILKRKLEEATGKKVILEGVSNHASAEQLIEDICYEADMLKRTLDVTEQRGHLSTLIYNAEELFKVLV